MSLRNSFEYASLSGRGMTLQSSDGMDPGLTHRSGKHEPAKAISDTFGETLGKPLLFWWLFLGGL